MFVKVCEYAAMYVDTWLSSLPAVCIHVYMCMCVCMCVCVCVCVCAYMCMYICTHIIHTAFHYIRMCIYTHNTYTHNTYTYTTHAHTYSHFLHAPPPFAEKKTAFDLTRSASRHIHFPHSFFKKKMGGKWTCFPFSSLHFVHASPHFTKLFQVLPLYMV